MDWFTLSAALFASLWIVAVLLRRRADLRQHSASLVEVQQARQRGSDRARLQHPKIDLTNCIGCGACVRACPEDGVLALAFGQAVVAHGARCVGHGLCASACPTQAIALTLGDLKDRRDLPAIDANHEAVGVPGLFLAGEITGFALVRTAVAHGRAVAEAIAQRPRAAGDEALDLLVVGLGPAGLACLLGARQHGLRALGVDQALAVGGTVASYPRRKLVMTQPMDLPLHGRLGRLEYTREQLVELWEQLVPKHRLDVRTGVVVQGIERGPDGVFTVATSQGPLRARNVCLAVGRRGSPQKLQVPGEELPKVAYSLLDAESYRDRRILVVGGGDSAIEAALALAEQPGNTVTISYRRSAFARLKARNELRVAEAIAAGRVQVEWSTAVQAIHADTVELRAAEAVGGGVATALRTVPNDEVFVFAGGTPPFPLLEAAGVSFDPTLRPAAADVDRGNGLLVSLLATAVGLSAALLLRHHFAAYYELPPALRSGSELHERLRPQGAFGLATGSLAVLLFAMNLTYLVRRAPALGRWLPGSLRAWMNVHVATGLAAAVCGLLHSGFVVRDSSGGHALLAMGVVVAAGAVGRWFYSFVPRAQNGRQQDLDEVATRVAAIAGEWDQQGRGFGASVRARIERLVDPAALGGGFFRRVFGLLRSQWQLRGELRQLRAAALAEGVPVDQVDALLALARRSHRLVLQLVHYDEVRGLLSLWRWCHRWLALLLLLLLVLHVVTALRFGGVDFTVFGGGAR